MKKLTIFLLLASCSGIGSHAAAGTVRSLKIKTFEYEGHDYITVVDSMGCIVSGGYFMHDPDCRCKHINKAGCAYQASKNAALESRDDQSR